MGKRSAGRKTIIPIVGHPSKTMTSENWARWAHRRGLGVIVDHILYWHTGQAFHTHRDRELREIETNAYELRAQACDLAHEHADHVDTIPFGPVMKTAQLEATNKEWANFLRQRAKAKHKKR